jgi:mannose-1-phosphate guanylyltransferase
MDYTDRTCQTSDGAGDATFDWRTQTSSGPNDRLATRAIVPVILSGGTGSRLWPFSTEETPKQFLRFMGEKTLFQLTLERVKDRQKFASPLIIGNTRHAGLCQRDLAEEHQDAELILEPFGRNTAAAITMAAAYACEAHGEDALVVVMPSDHVIEDVCAFHESLLAGEAAARSGLLVTFGIRPTGPDTGFGYIKVGAGVAGLEGVKDVLSFIEKPHLAAAQAMVADGEHLWNAGIFLFRAGTFLEEVSLHSPAIAAAGRRAIETGERQGNLTFASEIALAGCPSEAVDTAVMERSKRLAVVPMASGWSDLGSWDALAELVQGQGSHGPITVLDCADCYIRSDGVQVAALGVRDLIIVASGQRLLILPRGRSQEVKKLLSAMESIAA